MKNKATLIFGGILAIIFILSYSYFTDNEELMSTNSHGFRANPPSSFKEDSMAQPSIQIVSDSFISDILVKHQPSQERKKQKVMVKDTSPIKIEATTEHARTDSNKKELYSSESMFASPSIKGPKKKTMIHPASFSRAVLSQTIDATVKQPIVVAVLLDGKLKTGKLLGRPSFTDNRCYIQFTTLIYNNESISIKAIAKSNDLDGLPVTNISNPLSDLFNEVKNISETLALSYLSGQTPAQPSIQPTTSKHLIIQKDTAFNVFFYNGVSL
ncbi:hypothetical protein HOH45_08880 [bacterium]|jgi:hypothetical protein|nr:hypothetical protein [bacterium]